MTPGSSVPVSGGVNSLGRSAEPSTKKMFIPLISSTLRRLHEQPLRELGQGQAARRVGEPPGMGRGPESGDATGGLPIRLEAVEDHLGVVESDARGIQPDGCVGDELGAVPTAAPAPAD